MPNNDDDDDDDVLHYNLYYIDNAIILILGMVELCAKILHIVCNDFKDYACTFCQLCAYYAHLFRLCITHNWHSTIKRTF